MATLSTSSLNWLADEWEGVYKTAVLSGIVGDLAHKARGGYHISRQDQPSTNYSVIRPDDKPGMGPSDRAAAIDMTMSTADIIKCHKRLRAIWQNRSDDPRMKYINAWNGWDGEGDAGRYDVVKGTVTTATSDHKWHIHLEIRRRYVNDMNAMRAILSMLRGESISQYQGVTSPNPPKEEDDMALTEDEFDKIADRVWARAMGTNSTGTRWSTQDQPARNYLMLSAIYGYDVTKNLNALAQVVAGIGQRVDLEPAEIEALKTALAVPTADANADAVVDALGGLDPSQLADILTSILGPEKTAALKAEL